VNTYDVTFRTDLMVRTQVTASSPEEAHRKAAETFDADMNLALDSMDTPSHVLEVLRTDFFETEGVDA